MKFKKMIVLFTLLVLAIFSFQAQVQTAEEVIVLNVSQIEVSEFPAIKVYAQVTDETGQGILGLTNDAFTLTEQGNGETLPTLEEIAVEEMSIDEAIKVAIVIDNSPSMGYVYGDLTGIAAAKEAAKSFVDQMSSSDEACVIGFAKEATIKQTFTNDKDLLKQAIDGMTEEPYTSLYDGVYFGLEQFSGVTGVKALIVLADGDDNASFHTSTHVVDYANNLGVPVYSIGLGRELDPTRLADISDNTGGQYYEAPTADDLDQIYTKISQSIRGQYLITYTTHNTLKDELDRIVTVIVSANSYTTSDTKTYRSPFVKLWVEIISRDQARLGREHNFWMIYGNSGNVDAYERILVTICSSQVDMDIVGNKMGLYSEAPYEPVIEEHNEISGIFVPLIQSGSNNIIEFSFIPIQSDQDILVSAAFFPSELYTAQSDQDILVSAAFSPKELCTTQSVTTNRQILYQSRQIVDSMNASIRQILDSEIPPIGSTVFMAPHANNPFGHEGIVGTQNGVIGVWDVWLGGFYKFDEWILKVGGEYLGYGVPSGWNNNIGEEAAKKAAEMFAGGPPKFNWRFHKNVSDKGWSCSGIDEYIYESVGLNPIPINLDKRYTLTPWLHYRYYTGRTDFFSSATDLDPGICTFFYDMLVLEEQMGMGIILDLLRKYQTSKLIEVVQSIDPNDKAGPVGYGDSHFIPLAEQQLLYVIYFENLETATANAESIEITDNLDENLDWSWFQFGETSHPATMSFNSSTGKVTWTFENINLPPNVNQPEGEGWVSFTIKTKKDLSSGTQIRNMASIDFEIGYPPDPISTPEVINTIDSIAPSSSISELHETQKSTSFDVEWSGTDDLFGSGIRSYTVYVSDNDGEYQPWISDTTETSTIFTGEKGHTYKFYSIATDNVGNTETRDTESIRATTIKGGGAGGGCFFEAIK